MLSKAREAVLSYLHLLEKPKLLDTLLQVRVGFC